MGHQMYKRRVRRKLESAGLTINNDQADPQYNLNVFDEKIYTCSAMFRARQAQLMQMVLSPDGVAGGYRRVS